MSDAQYADDLFPEEKKETGFADDMFPTSVDAENVRRKMGGGPVQDFLFSNEKFSVARVLNHFGQGFKEGWGEKTGLSEENTKKLKDAGWFNDYAKGQSDLSKAAVEGLFHSGAVVFQTLAGGLKGVQEVVAKDAQDAFWSVGGVPQGFYKSNDQLGRDLAGMVDAFPHARPIRGTVGLPTISQVVPSAGEALLAQARAAKVIGHGEEGWRSGVTTDMPEAAYDVAAAQRTADGFAPVQDMVAAGKAIDEQRAFIVNDVREKLIAAGRPEAEADAAAAIDAAYWETRAARFGGAKGTAEEMYRAEAPEVVAGKSRADADTKTFAQDDARQAEPFYSAVEQAVTGAKIAKGSPDQWLGTLKNTPGVKPEEMEWLGLEQWLKSQGKSVSKEDVADYIRANAIEVKEVSKGDLLHHDIEAQRVEPIGTNGLKYLRTPQDIADAKRFNIQFRASVEGMSDDTILAAAERLREAQKLGEPKFSQYTLPGGENYREMLLTLPGKLPDAGLRAKQAENSDRIEALRQQMRGTSGSAEIRAEISRLARENNVLVEQMRAARSEQYKSAHWDEPNILAHVRFNDRVIDGKKTLFLEELQSDWHQAGKKKGYEPKTPGTSDDIEVKYIPPNVPEGADPTNYPGYWESFDRRTGNMISRHGGRMTEEMVRAEALGDLRHTGRGTVPDAPFKTTWPELILKRMIRYAAENGYEKIAWTPGEVQAARYDLSKQVRQVEYNKSSGGNSGRLEAIDHNGKNVLSREVTDDELPDIIGKDVADKLLNSPKKSLGVGGHYQSLSGLDLKVGGEGMKGFYDEILPATANKLVKKYGGRVQRGAAVGTDKPGYDIVSLDGSSSYATYGSATDAHRNLSLIAMENRVEQSQLKVRKNAQQEQPVHTLDLTPQLKDAAIEKGFPLFQGEGTVQRGRIRIREEGRNTITLLKDANASTFLHEKGHDYLARLIKDADDPIAPEALKADGQTVLKWLGVEKAEDIKTRHHEQFARGFENYIMEGKAPTQALARVFEQFRQWLLRIYTEAARLKAPINDEIRGVFDRMLALEPEQVKITEDRAMALRNEATAEVLPPSVAGDAASVVRAERDTMAGQLPEDLQNARLAEARTGIEGRAPGGPEPVGNVNAPEPVPGAGRIAQEPGAVSESGSPVAGQAPELAKAEGPVSQHESFGPHTDVADKAGNIRLDLLNTSDDVKKIISQVAEENEGFQRVRGPVTDVQVAELAEAMGMDASYLSTRKMGEAWTAPQIVALRNLLIQSASDVRDLMKKAANGDEAALQAYAEAKTRHMMIQERVSSVTSEAGRALRAFRKNFSSGMEDAASLGDFLKKETGQTLYQLQREAQLGASLETPAQVSKFIHDSKKATVTDMVQEAWINALLSGPTTHVVNFIGNTLVAVNGLVETAATAGVGKVRSALGSKGERVALGEAKAGLFGLLQGVQDGLKAAKYAFTHEEQYTRAQTVEQAKYQAIPSKRIVLKTFEKDSPEYNKRLDGIANARALAERLTGDALDKRVAQLKASPTSDMVAEAMERAVEVGGKQIRTPGRMLTAQDELFKTIAYRQKINELAYRQAAAENLDGNAFNQRVAQLTVNPSEEMMTAASKHADYQTFTNSLGQAGLAIQRFSNSHVLAKMVVPFVRTPLNILKYASERTPLGVFSREVRANLSGVNGKVAQDQQIARMALGTSMAIGAMYLADQGLITGGGPSDRNEKAALMLSGWRPYSVKIGEHYYSYHRLDPFSTIVGIAGDIADTIKKVGDADDDEVGKIAANLLASISKNILSKSSLRGASDLMNAATDPDRFGDRYIQNLAGTVVPTAVAQQARNFDEYQREVRSTLDAIKSRTPGLRTSLLPKRDIWGEPIRSDDALGPNAISPFPLAKLTGDRATQALLDAEFFPAKLTRKIRGVELTDQQYDDFARVAGRMAKMRVDAIVSNPGFENAPAELRSAMLKKAIDTSRESARSIIMMQNPDIIKQAMENKLSKVGR
jgi:hypothetical protein